MSGPRIVIVDDYQLLTDAMKTLLEPENEVVGAFTDGSRDVLTRIANLRPDVVIVDANVPTNGLVFCGHLKKRLPRVKALFLSASCDPELVAAVFQSGASGFVLKTSAGSELKTAIRTAMRGGYFATPSLIDGITGSFIQQFKHHRRAGSLTPRQSEVLQLTAKGQSIKQIANTLEITPRTVAFHKYTMMEHLNIGSTAELISYALKHRLCDLT